MSSIRINEVAASTPCRIGLWGTFDLPGFDALIPRVLRRELSERLPAAQIRASAPYGRLRPTPRDGGEPAESLGPWSPEGAAGQAADLDCIIVAGADLFPDRAALAARYGVDGDSIRALAPDRFFTDGPGPQAEGHCPVMWLGVSLGADLTDEETQRLKVAAARRPYISVLDNETLQRLVGATGITLGIEVVPDVALLAPRLHPPELLSKRLDYLRLMGWFPTEGMPLLVEGDSGLLPSVPALGAAIRTVLERHPDLPVVLAEMGSDGDREFADALAQVLPVGATTRLPGCVGLEDLSAALSACGAFAGSSYRAGLLAFAYDRPLAILNLGGAPHLHHLEGLAELVGITSCLVSHPGELTDVLELAVSAGCGPTTPGGPHGESHSTLHSSRLAALTRRVDACLDGVAEMAELMTLQRARPQPGPDAERVVDLQEHLQHLEVAHEARSRRLATERMVFANHLHKAEAEIARMRDEAAQLRQELADARNEVARAAEASKEAALAAAAAQAELVALRATRTFRYTAELRNIYGHLRRPGGPDDTSDR